MKRINSVYLAGRYERRGELNVYRAELAQAGIEVTSRWLTNDPPAPVAELTDEHWQVLAQTDFDDVHRADAFVIFGEESRDGGGGRHSEFGMALAWGKPIVVVGRREHLFHRLAAVEIAADWPTALSLLTGGAPRE